MTYLPLNKPESYMQSCQFAKSVSERGSGKFFAARLTAVSSASCCTVAAGRALFSSVTTTRCWQRFSVVRLYECGCPGARKFCWATCWTFELNFVRQGGMTDSVLPSGPYIHSALVVDGSGRMYYLLQLGWVVVYIIPFRWVGILCFACVCSWSACGFTTTFAAKPAS